jgi:hypothetical protein
VNTVLPHKYAAAAPEKRILWVYCFAKFPIYDHSDMLVWITRILARNGEVYPWLGQMACSICLQMLSQCRWTFWLLSMCCVVKHLGLDAVRCILKWIGCEKNCALHGCGIMYHHASGLWFETEGATAMHLQTRLSTMICCAVKCAVSALGNTLEHTDNKIHWIWNKEL